MQALVCDWSYNFSCKKDPLHYGGSGPRQEQEWVSVNAGGGINEYDAVNAAPLARYLNSIRAYVHNVNDFTENLNVGHFDSGDNILLVNEIDTNNSDHENVRWSSHSSGPNRVTNHIRDKGGKDGKDDTTDYMTINEVSSFSNQDMFTNNRKAGIITPRGNILSEDYNYPIYGSTRNLTIPVVQDMSLIFINRDIPPFNSRPSLFNGTNETNSILLIDDTEDYAETEERGLLNAGTGGFVPSFGYPSRIRGAGFVNNIN